MTAKRIAVKIIESSQPLGTQDGVTYSVYPIDRGCDCEPDFICSSCAGHFTETH